MSLWYYHLTSGPIHFWKSCVPLLSHNIMCQEKLQDVSTSGERGYIAPFPRESPSFFCRLISRDPHLQHEPIQFPRILPDPDPQICKTGKPSGGHLDTRSPHFPHFPLPLTHPAFVIFRSPVRRTPSRSTPRIHTQSQGVWPR